MVGRASLLDGLVRRLVAGLGETPGFSAKDEVGDFGGGDGIVRAIWHAVCHQPIYVAINLETRFSPKVTSMQYSELMLVAASAWQYSLAYLVLGGGFLGAIVVFFGAKVLGK